MNLRLVNGEDDGFLTTRLYRSAYGHLCELRYDGDHDDETRIWWFRVDGGEWQGPYSRIDRDVVIDGDVEEGLAPEGFSTGGIWASDLGKHEALLAASHHLGLSGAAADWRPAQ